MYIGLHVNYLCSCQILIKFEFSRRFSKNIQSNLPNSNLHTSNSWIIRFFFFCGPFSFEFDKFDCISNFMKIHPVGAELFQADGRTDMTYLTAAFRSFANTPKTGPSCSADLHARLVTVSPMNHFT